MQTFESSLELKKWRRTQGSIHFVPTMGALHEGHLQLIRSAQDSDAKVIVSIFVNPTQFNDPKDLERYPRPLAKDLSLLKDAGVDAVFLPSAKEIYHDQYLFELRDKKSEQILCGATRPGHFAGVLTVVLKLFNIVNPHKAFFGEKDFQQLQLIREMSKALFLDVEVIAVPTVREPDGLAMSSRNLLLSNKERPVAAQLFKILTTAKDVDDAKVQLLELGFKVDYIEEHWGRRFGAAFLGQVRLIDNVPI